MNEVPAATNYYFNWDNRRLSDLEQPLSPEAVPTENALIDREPSKARKAPFS
jgi:hypothetical protein